MVRRVWVFSESICLFVMGIHIDGIKSGEQEVRTSKSIPTYRFWDSSFIQKM
jgi:hypothetical protein